MFAESQCVVIYITKTALINGSVKMRYARTAGKLIVMMIYNNGMRRIGRRVGEIKVSRCAAMSWMKKRRRAL